VVERVETDGPVEITPHILVCGLHKNLETDLDTVTYLDEDGLSLYDFVHDESQLVTWMQHYPGGKAYRFRSHRSGDASNSNPRAGQIGRAVSEPCFGNGEEAKDVIRQVVVQRAGGADASEALHNILRSGRSVHFVVDRDGTVYEALDPTHAAVAPTDNANFAIYVALVAPRRLHEWLPEIVVEGGGLGLSGALASADPQSIPRGAGASVRPPDDASAERAQCTVAGQEVTSEPYTAAQERALAKLLHTLDDEYPELTLDPPIAPDGSTLREHMDDSPYHKGVLAAYHAEKGAVEPACLDLDRVLAVD